METYQLIGFIKELINTGTHIIMIATALVLIGSYYVIKKGKDFFDKSVKLNDWKDGDKSGQC